MVQAQQQEPSEVHRKIRQRIDGTKDHVWWESRDKNFLRAWEDLFDPQNRKNRNPKDYTAAIEMVGQAVKEGQYTLVRGTGEHNKKLFIMENTGSGKVLATITCSSTAAQQKVFDQLTSPPKSDASIVPRLTGSLEEQYADLVRSRPRNVQNHWIVTTYKRDAVTGQFISFEEAKGYILSKLRDFVLLTGVKELEFREEGFIVPERGNFAAAFGKIKLVAGYQVFEINLSGAMYNEVVKFLAQSGFCESFTGQSGLLRLRRLNAQAFLDSDAVKNLPENPSESATEMRGTEIIMRYKESTLSEREKQVVKEMVKKLEQSGMKVEKEVLPPTY